MSTGYKITQSDDLYYLTFQVVEWVDLFTRKIYRDIILESLSYCVSSKGLLIYGYVVMSNHIHLIARSINGELSAIIRDFKKYTSRRILHEVQNSGIESRRNWLLSIFSESASNHTRNSNYQVWTHENHAEILYSNAFIDEKLNYIHQNPVRAGLVSCAEHYLYSSASNYKAEGGLLDIVLIDQTWGTY